MSGFTAVGFFLVSMIFSILILILWIRIALRYLKVSSLSPFSQLVLSATNPVITPIQNLLGIKYQASQRYDWLAFSLLILVEFFKIVCMSLLAFHAILPVGLMLVYILADLIIQPCDLLFYAILIRVIMSFVNPGWHHPIADFLRLVTEPLLRFGRTLVPNISGFDFSPFIIMMILKVVTLFLSNSLPGRLL